jgi:hypothetical protein
MSKAFAVGLLLALSSSLAAADDKQKLVGTWKVVSIVTEYQDTGEKRAVFGESPRGYQIFAPDGRFIWFVTADGRKTARTGEEMAEAFRTMAGSSGTYQVEGDKLMSKTDVASTTAWVGLERVSTFKLDGGRLHFAGSWGPSGLRPGAMIRSVSVWEREKAAPSQ